MNKLIAFLGACNKYLCALFLGSMVLVVFVNTVLRYVFNSGIIQAEELVRYLFIWAIYLAVISVYYEHNHISVTTLTDRLSPRGRLLMGLFAGLVSLYALAVLTQGSVMYFIETTTMGQVTKIPYKVAVAAVLTAAVCCLCIVVADVVKKIRTLVSGEGA